MSTVITIDIAKIHADAASVEKFGEALDLIQKFLSNSKTKVTIKAEEKSQGGATEAAPQGPKTSTKIARPLSCTVRGGQHLKQHKDEDAETFYSRVAEAKQAYKARMAAKAESEKKASEAKKTARIAKHEAQTAKAHEARNKRFAEREVEADNTVLRAKALASTLYGIYEKKSDGRLVISKEGVMGKDAALWSAERVAAENAAIIEVSRAMNNTLKDRVRKRDFSRLPIKEFDVLLGGRSQPNFVEGKKVYYDNERAHNFMTCYLRTCETALTEFRHSLPTYAQKLGKISPRATK